MPAGGPGRGPGLRRRGLQRLPGRGRAARGLRAGPRHGLRRQDPDPSRPDRDRERGLRALGGRHRPGRAAGRRLRSGRPRAARAWRWWMGGSSRTCTSSPAPRALLARAQTRDHRDWRLQHDAADPRARPSGRARISSSGWRPPAARGARRRARRGAGERRVRAASSVGLVLIDRRLPRGALSRRSTIRRRWTRHLNNLLMLVAVCLFGIGPFEEPRARLAAASDADRRGGLGGRASAGQRRPRRRCVLFGGLGLWALAEMAVINAREPDWAPPAPGPVARRHASRASSPSWSSR